jgi:hypothetical protein
MEHAQEEDLLTLLLRVSQEIRAYSTTQVRYLLHHTGTYSTTEVPTPPQRYLLHHTGTVLGSFPSQQIQIDF